VIARIGPNFPEEASIAEVHRLTELATQIAPDNADAWYWLGEVFYHFGAAEGVADAPTRAIAAFEHALSLDSSDTRPLEHLPELYYVRGDTASMRRAIDARLARDTTRSLTVAMDYFFEDQVLGRHDVRPKWAEFNDRADIALLVGQVALPAAAIDTALATGISHGLTDNQRARNAQGLVQLALVRGQPARAMRIVRQIRDASGIVVLSPSSLLLQYVLADLDSTSAADARKELASKPASGASPNRAFAVALYDLALGNSETARNGIVRLRAIPPAGCDKWRPHECAIFALILDAQLSAAEHRADAGQRLAQLDSVLRTGPVWDGPVLEAGNLIAGRLWEAAGDNTHALAAVRRRGHFFGAVRSIATYFREEGRLAAALGERAEAIDAYTKYLTLRQDAEPSMRQDLAGIRREVERLKKEQAGK
jgi:tetratricopeptide (TPR) repeat protein